MSLEIIKRTDPMWPLLGKAENWILFEKFWED